MSPSQQPFPHQQIESISYPWSTQGFSSPLYLVTAPEGSLCFASLHPTLVPGHEASPRGTSPQFLPIPIPKPRFVDLPCKSHLLLPLSSLQSQPSRSPEQIRCQREREKRLVTYKDQLRFFLSKRFHSSAKRDPRAFLSINSLLLREDHFLSQGLLSIYRKQALLSQKNLYPEKAKE